MQKQWWELFPEINQQGNAAYCKDVIIVLTGITKAPDINQDGSIQYKRYGNGQSPGYAFGNVSVQDQSGQSSVGMSFSFAEKDGQILDQNDLNKPFQCEIKVTNDNSQYAINGKKYTIRFPQQSGGQQQQQSQPYQQNQGNQNMPNSGGNNSTYTPRDFVAEARGKVSHGVICAAIQSKQLPCTSEAEVSAWVDLIMAYGESKQAPNMN